MSNIVVPQLGESVVEARVAKWLKKVGDRVSTGEPVVELETDKIDLEVGADHSGVLSTIKRGEGEDVKVGDVLAVVDESAAGTQPPAKEQPAAPAARTQEPEARKAAPAPAPAPEEPQAAPESPKATPTAKRI